jgi:TolB-like protein/Flp pilus assembly protein TadD
VNIGVTLASALAHLHKHGLIHRDVKPSNIIFVSGVPKLADIGLVADASEARSFVGTVGFIPPEGPGSPQADLYSLGKVLYETSTGQDRQDFPQLPPDLLRAVEPRSSRRKEEGGKQKTVVEQSLDTSAATNLIELNEVLLKACHKDLRQRYPSADAMRADLELLQRGKSVQRKHAAERRRTLARHLALATVTIALLATAGSVLWNRFTDLASQRVNGVAEVNSIAVLPFVNQDNSEPHEYLAAILSDETRNALTNCSGLRVAPRPAAFAAKHGTNNFRAIGKELGVRTVLTGTVNKTSNQLNVAARLINVADGAELWSASYDRYRRTTNIVEIASQVTSNVVRVLHLPLEESALRRLESNFIPKIAAYRIYSVASTNMGSAAANTQDGFDKTIQLLNETLAKDPSFGAAYADLADIYWNGSGWYMSPNVAMPTARMNAERALVLDRSLWKAHCALAMVCGNHELDFTNAEVHCLRAIEAAPRNSKPYTYYAGFLSLLGRHDEAERMLARAAQLEPTRGSLLAMLCWHDYRQRRYEEMLARATRLSTLYPDSLLGFLLQARAHERLTNYTKALEMAQQMKQLDPSPDFIAFLGLVQARLGDVNGAQRSLTDVRAITGGRRGLPPYDTFILLGLGQTNEVIERLRQAVDDYRPNALFLISEAPILDELRFDPRLVELLKKAGLEK